MKKNLDETRKQGWYTLLALVVIAFAVYIGFTPLFNLIEDGIASRVIGSSFGAIFVIILTMFLLNKQTDIEQESKKSERVFDEKVKIYQMILDITRDMLMDGDLTKKEVNRLPFPLLRLQMLSDNSVIDSFADVYSQINSIYTNGSDDEKKTDKVFIDDDARNDLYELLSAFSNACRADLEISNTGMTKQLQTKTLSAISEVASKGSTKDKTKFSFNGTNVSIDQHPNEGRHALHGHGCFSNWSVAHTDANSAEITYQHEAGQAGWPWSYRASQRFEVSDNKCLVTISVTNTSDSQMPLGIGFHPFFPFDGDINLRFNADEEWVGSPETFPTERRPLTHNFHSEQGERLWQETKTVCFEGFKGEVEIHWGRSNRRLLLTSDKLLNHFIVHIPDGASYFCLEPVCHPTDAFNLSARNVEGVDVLTLNKGRTQSTSMVLAKI